MNAPEQFEIAGNRGIFRPGGSVSLAQAVEMVTAAIVFARAQGLSQLLVNATALVGFDSPSLSERYFLAEEWAYAADGTLHVALVVHPEMIDPKKFGVTVARNRGMVADVFAVEVEAVAWLDSLK
jgi:hypothetical protein